MNRQDDIFPTTVRPWTGLSLLVLATLAACATGQEPVIEKFDELTAVTYTYSRTPQILSPETPLDSTAMRDYVQIGVIEVNRMGSLRYFMWLGISAAATDEQSDTHAEGFNSIELVLGEHSFRLDILGWREEVIGVSETVYKKLFSTSVDAYYEVTLQQIEQVSNAERVKLRTTGETPQEFVSWYKQTTAKEDLAAFLDEVLR